MEVENSGPNGLISRYTYSYNSPAHKDARTRVEVEGEAPQRLDYSYDAVDQLLGEARSWNDGGAFKLLSRRFYAYDPMGNRTRGEVESANAAGSIVSTTDWTQQNNGLNQILSLSGSTRDAAGTLVQQSQSTFHHDKSGNLRERRNDEGIVTSRYDYDEADRLIAHPLQRRRRTAGAKYLCLRWDEPPVHLSRV